jgi:hypothetical protein
MDTKLEASTFNSPDLCNTTDQNWTHKYEVPELILYEVPELFTKLIRTEHVFSFS